MILSCMDNLVLASKAQQRGVDATREILECFVSGLEIDGDERVPIFVVDVAANRHII